MLIIIIIIIIYPLLVIGWQSSGNSRSQEEIKVTYPSNLRIIVIVIIIIIIFVITFMQGIYNYMPETNHVYRVHTVAAVRYLQFVLHVYNNNNSTTRPNPVDYYIPG